MSSAATAIGGKSPAARPLLRPLILPTEHGGWGFLFEPLLLGLAVAPSVGGTLVALAFALAFLTRQPLRLALQDALRGKVYPRTRWCRGFAAAYAAGALASLAGAVTIAGWTIVLPLVLVAPLGLVQLTFDARNRSRALLPELAGSVAMSASTAAIAIAAGTDPRLALALSALVVARGIPTIVYVRTLLARAHGQVAASWPPVLLHAAAFGMAASFAPALVVVALALLFARAAWQLASPVVLPARRLGWTEIAWGLLTVALCAAAFL